MTSYTGHKLYRILDPSKPLGRGRYAKRDVPLPPPKTTLERKYYKGQLLEFLASPGQIINLRKEAKRQIERARLINIANLTKK